MDNLTKAWKIASIITLAVIVVLLFWNAQNLEQFKPVANLNFEESEWIKINDAKFYNTHRTGVIFPNYPLTLVLNVTNKNPLNTGVQPHFYTYMGGSLTDSQVIYETIFGHEHTGKISPEYFPKTPGLNTVKVALKISYSNGTFLTFQNATTSFDVLSQSDKLRLDQNNFILAGVMASAVIGGGTLTALYFNQRTSNKEIDLLQKQNQDLKKQTSIQNRPWVSLISEHAVIRQGDLFQIKFENYGKSVATNIITKSMVKKGEITLGELIENRGVSTEFDLSPQERFSHTVSIPEDIRNVLDTDRDIHIGIIVKYKFEGEKKGKSVLIARWNPKFEKIYYVIKKLK